jgi:hypothetical protein
MFYKMKLCNWRNYLSFHSLIFISSLIMLFHRCYLVNFNVKYTSLQELSYYKVGLSSLTVVFVINNNFIYVQSINVFTSFCV